MYRNLEAERERCGYAEEFVARKLGLTEQAYRLRVESGAFRLSEARELAALYNQPIEYLFQSL
jgi:DNA-binding XRE family transcriptional regulator